MLRYSFSAGGIVAVLIGLATALFLYRWFYKKFVLREDELLANGLGFEQERLVKDKDGFLRRKLTKKTVAGYFDKSNAVFVLTKFSRELNNENILQKYPTIEKITGRKVVEARIEKHHFFSFKAVFYLENFKERIGLKDLKRIRLNPGDFFVGLNARREPVICSTVEEMNWITTIIGGQGSGKTTAIASQIFTYLKSFTDNRLPPPRLVVVDIKKTDFLPLMDFYSKKGGEVLFFNPLDLEDLKRLNLLLESYLTEMLAFFKRLAVENISVRHWHYLTGEIAKERPTPICWCLDEGPAYLSVAESKIRLGKEPTELELRAYEEQEERKKLSLLIARLFNTARPTGTSLWFASQSGSVSDLAIPFVNLRSNFFLSKTTGVTAQIWGVPPELATRSDLRRGLFIYSSSKETGLVKTPMIEIGGEK